MRRLNKHYDAFAVFYKIKENIIIPPELKDTDYGYLKNPHLWTCLGSMAAAQAVMII